METKLQVAKAKRKKGTRLEFRMKEKTAYVVATKQNPPCPKKIYAHGHVHYRRACPAIFCHEPLYGKIICFRKRATQVPKLYLSRHFHVVSESTSDPYDETGKKDVQTKEKRWAMGWGAPTSLLCSRAGRRYETFPTRFCPPNFNSSRSNENRTLTGELVKLSDNNETKCSTPLATPKLRSFFGGKHRAEPTTRDTWRSAR